MSETRAVVSPLFFSPVPVRLPPYSCLHATKLIPSSTAPSAIFSLPSCSEWGFSLRERPNSVIRSWQSLSSRRLAGVRSRSVFVQAHPPPETKTNLSYCKGGSINGRRPMVNGQRPYHAMSGYNPTLSSRPCTN